MKIKTKKLEFPKEIQDKCERYLKRKTLEITYLNGYMVEFKGTNLSTISPHKILIKSSNSTGSIANLRLPPVLGIPYKAANIPLTQSHMFPCEIIKVTKH